MGKKAKSDGKSRIVIADQGLEFVNRSGKVLARLREAGDDTTMLSLLGIDGVPIVTLGATGGSAFVRVGSGTGKVTIYAGGSNATIQLFENGDDPQVHLGTTDDGGLMEVSNVHGKSVASLCTMEDGGLVTIANGDVIVGGLVATPHGGGLFVDGDNGQRVAALYARNGEGFVEAYDAQGKEKTTGEQQTD